MSEAYYRDAMKLGLKRYRACVSRGLSPCLPVMDDFVSEERSLSGVDLGLVQIPTELIVGTKTRGRAHTFADNYMPIAEVNSEFAAKWQSLCAAHLQEGIREPILAYEYLNRFYVAEGNKRVSVLKYFAAPEVLGRVIRVLPERGEHTALYYEFVDFYRLSGVNYIEFSHAGGYKALQRLVGKAEDEPWTEEDRRQFFISWHYFRQAYDSLGGTRLRSTVGDAMLACMEIYGYPCLCGKSAAAVKEFIAPIWEEIALQQEEEPIDLKLDPRGKKPGLVQKVLSSAAPKRLQAAFIHDGTPESSAWTKGHERGRQYVQRVLEDKIQTSACFDALADDPLPVIEQAIEAGNSVIFTTSPRLLNVSLRAAVAHPEVTVFNCSLNMSHRYIRTYYPRMYEIRFITGAVAAALSGGKPLGYLADYPIFGQIAGVNAFALGAQMVDPEVKVCLEWSTAAGGEAALSRFADQGVTLVSARDQLPAGSKGEVQGLLQLKEGRWVNLATPLWQWGSYYEQLLRLLRDRSLRSDYQESHRALNYYWGLSAGVVELRCSAQLPAPARKLAELLQQGIREGFCRPFLGPLFSQEGQVLAEDGALTPEQIIRMDWLAENVVGSIPSYDQLTERGRATVDMMGVGRAHQSKRG